MLQRMRLRFLEVVATVDGIEPRIQEVLGPLSIAHNEAARCDSILVLRHNHVYAVALEVSKGLDDAVWGDHGLVDNHEFLETRRREEVGLQREGGIHNERGAVEEPDEGGPGVEGHGVPHGGNFGPRKRGVPQWVVCVVGKECCVAFNCPMLGSDTSLLWDAICLIEMGNLHIPCLEA
jgi:hypothetical protein